MHLIQTSSPSPLLYSPNNYSNKKAPGRSKGFCCLIKFIISSGNVIIINLILINIVLNLLCLMDLVYYYNLLPYSKTISNFNYNKLEYHYNDVYDLLKDDLANNPYLIKRYDVLNMNQTDIDNLGLDQMDRLILKTLVEKFHGGPVGLDSLGVAIAEDARTIEEVYEPYLIKEGFIQRTPRGRKVLPKAYKHLKIDYPEDN